MKLGMIKRAAKAVIDIVHLTSKDEDEAIVNAFQGGALWMESKAWELASRRLPEIDREVVVLTQEPPCKMYRICFGHRVNPNEQVHVNGKGYMPKGYGKGNWNIEGVVYWLDLPHPFERKKKKV